MINRFINLKLNKVVKMTVENIKIVELVEDEEGFDHLQRKIEDVLLKFKDANSGLDELELIHLFDRVGLKLFKESWSNYKKTDLILDHILSEF